MSQYIGDKARANRIRKQRIRLRERLRNLGFTKLGDGSTPKPQTDAKPAAK